METAPKIVEFRLTREKALVFLTFLLLAWHPGVLNSEQLVLTTYYPAPYGGYVKLLTTGSTYLARDGGNVGIGPTGLLLAKLHVSGNVRLNDALMVNTTNLGFKNIVPKTLLPMYECPAYDAYFCRGQKTTESSCFNGTVHPCTSIGTMALYTD